MHIAAANGLLLRADIHTLLDLQLLAFEPETRTVVVSRLLAGTQYEPLATRRLHESAAEGQRPSQAALDKLWQDFEETEAAR